MRLTPSAKVAARRPAENAQVLEALAQAFGIDPKWRAGLGPGRKRGGEGEKSETL